LLLFDVEAACLIFVQSSQTGCLNGADMNEDILATGIGRDKPATFGWVKPFYNALGMRAPPFCRCGERPG
jgi:hypothetical protein